MIDLSAYPSHPNRFRWTLFYCGGRTADFPGLTDLLLSGLKLIGMRKCSPVVEGPPPILPHPISWNGPRADITQFNGPVQVAHHKRSSRNVIFSRDSGLVVVAPCGPRQLSLLEFHCPRKK